MFAFRVHPRVCLVNVIKHIHHGVAPILQVLSRKIALGVRLHIHASVDGLPGSSHQHVPARSGRPLRSCLRRAGRLPKLPGRGSLPFVGRLPPCIHAVKNGQRKRCCGSTVRDKLEINPEVDKTFNQLQRILGGAPGSSLRRLWCLWPATRGRRLGNLLVRGRSHQAGGSRGAAESSVEGAGPPSVPSASSPGAPRTRGGALRIGVCTRNTWARSQSGAAAGRHGRGPGDAHLRGPLRRWSRAQELGQGQGLAGAMRCGTAPGRAVPRQGRLGSHLSPCGLLIN